MSASVLRETVLQPRATSPLETRSPIEVDSSPLSHLGVTQYSPFIQRSGIITPNGSFKFSNHNLPVLLKIVFIMFK
ncbi:hypothetical protein GE061_016973 [Apolygus lucorum]|uniref:Uncharacterized protein n=1 Tax=Apolygus lucorum TaxID=248454 RepID=A0A6A4K7C9_APOLU|nr:hypothetical protein GE061_016973 [Apolygus lucorum]